MYNLSTKAHKGPQQPTKANAGPRRGKRAQTMERYIFFLLYILFFILPAGCTTPTTPLFGVDDSHKSPQRPQQPTKADVGPQRGKRAQTTPDASFGHR